MNTSETNDNQNNEGKEPKYRPSRVQNFRTLQGDMVDAVKKQDRSLTSMVLSAKEKKWEGEKKDGQLEKVYIKNKYKHSIYKVLLVGIILSIATLIGVQKFFHDESSPSEPQPSVMSELQLILPKQNLFIDITNIETTLPEKLTVELQNSSSTNAFIKIDLIRGSSTTPVSTEEFTMLWAHNIPTFLLDSLKENDYIFAAEINDDTPRFFVAYELTENDDALNNLKSWEPYIFDDINLLFVQQATKTPREVFVDAVVKNKSLRVLEYGPQDPALLYGFVGKQTFVISNSVNIFTHILDTLENL
ncbi:MAG: hypothetical protein KAS07_05885 [Candidatus Pacebacteria bacterium]|nr:hypothetical protein [Candidatus Paceibacterota bacterium]